MKILIPVIAKDENGCYSNDTIILKVVDCTSIEEHLSNTTLFPNPTTGEFIIQHESLNNDIQKIEISRFTRQNNSTKKS